MPFVTKEVKIIFLKFAILCKWDSQTVKKLIFSLFILLFGLLLGFFPLFTSASDQVVASLNPTEIKPILKSILIPPGLRKEEIAEILATNLSWTKT